MEAARPTSDADIYCMPWSPRHQQQSQLHIDPSEIQAITSPTPATMICARCMLRTLRSQSRHHARHYSTIQSLRAAQQSLTEHQATVSSPQGPSGAPSATSTSAAQPFSTPLSASPTAHGMDSKPKSQSPLVISSVPAGTPLKGLNFMKGKSDPLAMEDHEYPEWLWRILEDKKAAAETGTDGDIYCMSIFLEHCLEPRRHFPS